VNSSIFDAYNYIKDEPMSRHTTFRTGGPATLFLRPENEKELTEIVAILKRENYPFMLLGNGSNLLVSDKGYEGAVISLESLSGIDLEGEDIICAKAGALNSQIALFARQNCLTGFEFAAGIPGTIGGAMIMNAGAYGGEMKLITKSVRVVTPKGEVKELSANECDFGYRTSALKREGYIVLEARLQLQKGDQAAITEKMTELALKRKEKQPLEYPSAGSTFKRPEGYFAGKLIDDAGLRGFRVGDAQVSEKHCGFVINRGNATSSEIHELIEQVQKKVYESFGVTLETEVIMVGDFK
jgi:UDP-N-acetylmuramate dehydrogenase